MGYRETGNRENRKCLNCGSVGRIAKNCCVRNNEDLTKPDRSSRTETTMLIISSTLINTILEQSRKWTVDTASTRHMKNEKKLFSDFMSDLGVMLVGNDETMSSSGVDLIIARMAVNGKTHCVILHEEL